MGKRFARESVVGALHCQIGGRWAKLKSGDIRAWKCQIEVEVLEDREPPEKTDMQKTKQLQE